MQRWVNKLRQSDKQIFFEISNLVPLTFRIKGNMVRSWLLSDKITNIHLPNEQTPNVPVSVNELKSLGVLYYQARCFIILDSFSSIFYCEETSVESKRL